MEEERLGECKIRIDEENDDGTDYKNQGKCNND